MSQRDASQTTSQTTPQTASQITPQTTSQTTPQSTPQTTPQTTPQIELPEYVTLHNIDHMIWNGKIAIEMTSFLVSLLSLPFRDMINPSDPNDQNAQVIRQNAMRWKMANIAEDRQPPGSYILFSDAAPLCAMTIIAHRGNGRLSIVGVVIEES